MDNFLLLIIVGFFVGTIGTLIGAGGGFILVPLLILRHPEFSAEITTAVSIAIVAGNALSGSIAYARAGRIDYRAGFIFAAFTVPGSILGVYTTSLIPKTVFNIIFGVLLISLAIYLFIKKQVPNPEAHVDMTKQRWKRHAITDRSGQLFRYTYNQTLGILVSVVVGYISPLLGIGGGIIHVPALVNLLKFPVFVATATSHFILAIMASVSVIIHIINGSYDEPYVLRMVFLLLAGVIAGAQLGAYLSHKLQGSIVLRSLAVCLGVVGIRILISG